MNGNQEDSNADAQEERDDFSAAVAEFSGEGKAPEDNSAGDPGPENDQPAVDEPSSPAGDTTPGDQSKPAAGDLAPEGAPSDDIWKDATPAQREAYEKVMLANQSLKGRASAADRRLNEVLRNAQQQGDGQGKTSASAKAKDALASDKMKQFREDYSEIADVILPAIEALAEGQEQLSAPVDVLTAHALDNDEQRRINTYAEAHPDWQAWANDPRWVEFAESQPRGVQEALARNQNVEDPVEAAWVLGLFKEWAGGVPQGKEGNPVQSQTHSTTGQPANPGLNDRRKRQLDAGRDGGSSGNGAAVSGIPDDFNQAVMAFAKKADQQAASHR